jgi:hypothetical protein
MMQPPEALPNTTLTGDGPVTAAFQRAGIADFHGAARHLQALPYGRISDRARPGLVLVEGRGTCSSKHALLAELAGEVGLDVRLTLGIFEMSARTHPELTAILERHGLPYVPEAHCYVRHRDGRIDITRQPATPGAPIARFLHEETITPAQTASYKVEVHRRFLSDWIARTPRVRDRSLEDIWRVREECIVALGEA